MVDERDVLTLLHEDRRTLPRLVTLVENGDPRGLDVLDAVYHRTGHAHVVGITGPPGVGKSSLIAALVKQIRASNARVAVLAIDPSSPLTGGAVLGDRIRLMDWHTDPDVFIRSMASRGRQGGLAWSASALVDLFDAVGFPIILVETVGTGQDGTDIASLAETIVVVQSPGLGDGVQAIKAGLLDIGDIVVVNKADRPDAIETERHLRAGLSLGHRADGRVVPVLATSATEVSGFAELLAAIEEHAAWLESSGQRDERRALRTRTELLSGLRVALDDQLRRQSVGPGAVQDSVQRVLRKEQSPRQAVAEMVAVLARG